MKYTITTNIIKYNVLYVVFGLPKHLISYNPGWVTTPAAQEVRAGIYNLLIVSAIARQLFVTYTMISLMSNN